VQVLVIICLFTKVVGCVCIKWVTGTADHIRVGLRITDRRHTVDKNSVHLNVVIVLN